MPLNKQLLAKVVNQIVSHPETRSQEEWNCDTSHCFAGWTQVFGHGPMGQYVGGVSFADDAADLLGLTPDDARYLFSSLRTISEIHIRASELITERVWGEYDEYGYNEYGIDRDGYDRNGYDRDGYDRYGRDRERYNRDGYRRNEYDRYGRDPDGRDRDGYDRNGRDRHGNSLPMIVVD